MKTNNFKNISKTYVTITEQKYFQKIINNFEINSKFQTEAFELGITKELIKKSIQPFSKEFFTKYDEKKFHQSFQNAIQNELEIDLLQKLFLKFIMNSMETDTLNLDSIINLLNLKKPEEEFPEARKLKRKIIFHTGPTNSGKSYSSIERLLKSKTGVYCSPLRYSFFEKL